MPHAEDNTHYARPSCTIWCTPEAVCFIIHLVTVCVYCMYAKLHTFVFYCFNRQLVKSISLFILGIYVAREVANAETSAAAGVS